MSSPLGRYVPPHKRHERNGSTDSFTSERPWRSNASNSPPSSQSSSRSTSPISSNSPGKALSAAAKWERGAKISEDLQWEEMEVGRVYFLDQYAIQQSRHINYWANRRAHTGFVNHPVVVLGKEKDPDGGGIVWFKPCTSNPVRERHGFRQIGQPGVRRGDNILPLTHDTRDAMPKATFVDPRADIWVVEPSAIKPFIDNKKQSIIRLTAESVAILDRPYQRAEMMKEMSRPGYG